MICHKQILSAIATNLLFISSNTICVSKTLNMICKSLSFHKELITSVYLLHLKITLKLKSWDIQLTGSFYYLLLSGPLHQQDQPEVVPCTGTWACQPPHPGPPWQWRWWSKEAGRARQEVPPWLQGVGQEPRRWSSCGSRTGSRITRWEIKLTCLC